MPRTRWFVVGFLLAAVIGGLLNVRGPFDAHAGLAYEAFLADFQAGKVEQIVQWRDRLEVTEQGGLISVVVPVERDLQADLGRARWAGGVGISYVRLPDAWIVWTTPWFPLLLTFAAVLIWVAAMVRDRRSRSGSIAASSPQTAG